MARKLQGLVLLLCVISAWQFGTAAYIHAKAAVARWLIQDAWTAIRQGQAKVRPWPWADTWPVARLKVPGLDIDQMVLAGASGRTLAFAPGWLEASAMPGKKGVSVIAAHRDTHFSFLRHLRLHDVIEIETPTGAALYRVTGQQVADSSRQRILPRVQADELVLVTCYPFDALVPGGDLRYLVFSEKIPLTKEKNTHPNGLKRAKLLN